MDEVWSRLPPEVPSLREVQTLLDSVREYINLRNQRTRYHDLQTWRHRMLESQADRFRWAKAKYVPWQSVDDTRACFDKVESVWRPILRQQATPSVASRAAAASPVPVSPLASTLSQVNLLDITGSQLRAAVQKVPAHSACGADGWRRSELLALPTPFWDMLASVLCGMATAGVWHPCLTTVLTSLIPKKADTNFLTDPGGLRPISVASLVYRAWSGVLAKRLHALLECSLTPSSHGFRCGESAQTAMACTYLKCQNSSLAGQGLHIITYDMHKCFDSLPWDKVHRSLLACGVHGPTAHALRNHWCHIRRLWKLQGRFCEASFSATNGLLQGDPSAPACLVAFLCEPIRRIQTLWPAVSISQYADDVLFSSCDAAQLRQAHDYFAHWLQSRQVDLNAHKCFWASTIADPVLPDLWVGNVLLKRTDVLETLGGRLRLGAGSGSVPLSAGCVGDSDQWNKIVGKFMEVAKRLGHLSVGYDLRSADLGALMSMLSFSAVLWDPCQVSDARRQRALVNMLAGGKYNTRRCLEVCLGLLSPIHRSSIPEALVHEQVSVLCNLLNTNLEFQDEVRRHFVLCSHMQNPPADSFFARFQAALRVYGWRWSDWSQLTARNGEVFELRGQLLETRRYAVRSALLCAQHAQQLTDCIAQMSLAHKSAMGGLRGPVLHALRDDMRLTLFRKADQRRRDMVDLHKVDRTLLQTVFRRLPRETHPSFRFLLQGAMLTADRTHRSTRGRSDPNCPYCQSAVENEVHRFWVCPAWHDIRCSHLGANHAAMCEMLRGLQNTASMCGIPVHDLPCSLKAKWVDVCACMVDILRAVGARDQPEE